MSAEVSLKVLVGMVGALLALTRPPCAAGAAQYGPKCIEECNKAFTDDDLIEHPGVRSVCHRGCELFTVAFITTPRGGVEPLVGPQPGEMPASLMASLDPQGIPLGPALFPIKKIKQLSIVSVKNNKEAPGSPMMLNEKTKVSNKKTSLTSQYREKANKEKEKVEQTITKKMNDVMKISSEINVDIEKSLKQAEKSNLAVMLNQKNPPKIIAKTTDKIGQTFGGNKRENKKILEFHDIFDDCPNMTDEEIKVIHDQYLKNANTEIKSEKEDDTVKNDNKGKTNLKDATPSIQSSFSASPSHIQVFTGNKAREILNESRIIHTQRPKEFLDKKVTSDRAHGPVKIQSKKVVSSGKGSSHNSKTTVQPVSYPVQDHPVQAHKQITTDASNDSSSRKTTITPESMNPYIPISLSRIQEMNVVNKLASKLSKGGPNSIIHPLLQVTLMKPRLQVLHSSPSLPQISIIEIVKKKNNIDFDRLHQEHMEGAALCPTINERLDSAKQSCRHACVMAYQDSLEQDACIHGCHLRAASSFNQVEAERPRTTNPDKIKRLQEMPFKLEDSLMFSKSGLLNSMSDIMSNLASKFGNGSGGGTGGGTVGVELTLHQHTSTNSRQSPDGPVVFMPRGGKITETVVEVMRGGTRLTIPQTQVHIMKNSMKPAENDMTDLIENFLGDKRSFVTAIKEEFEKRPKEPKPAMDRDLEIMGLHLNEKPRELQIPKFIKDIILSTSGLKKNDMKNEDKSNYGVTHVSMVRPGGSSVNEDIFITDNKPESEVTSSSRVSEKDARLTKPILDDMFQDILNSKYIGGVTVTNLKMPKDANTGGGNSQIDLLDCIAKRVGLPMWFMVLTMFGTAVIVFWLCFSLAGAVDESKLYTKKKTAALTSFVPCDVLEGATESEKKQLLLHGEEVA